MTDSRGPIRSSEIGYRQAGIGDRQLSRVLVLYCSQFDIDRNLDILADYYSACRENLIVGKPEVRSVELRRRAECGPIVTPRVRAFAFLRHVENDWTCYVANRE